MNKKVIICVDDEKVVVESLKEQIRSHFLDEYQIETAQSGEEALEILDQLIESNVDVPVVISDHLMPGLRGDDLLIQIHKRSPSTIKIMLTGQASADAVGKVINSAQLYRYIPKPWEKDDLILTIKEAVSSYIQKKKLSSIMTLSQHIAAIHDEEELLEHVMLNSVVVTNAQRGFLFMNKDGSGELEIRASQNYTKNEYFSGLSKHIVNTVYKTGEEIIISEEQRDYSTSVSPHIQYKDLVNDGIKSVLCIPMRFRNKILGVCYLDNPLTGSLFKKEDCEMLRVFISQAAIAIENANLYNNQVKLAKAYKRFVPVEYLNYLNKVNITDLQLGDQIEREMTVMFSDIRSFTELSEHMTPKENFDFLNRFLKHIVPVIRDNGGFVDKYIGDAIMALYGDNPVHAVKAAVEMQKKTQEFNKELERDGIKPIKIGIGLHKGRLMMGTIGEEGRMEGTVISDAVNLGSRLEGMTKEYGSSIIISDVIMDKVKHRTEFKVRFLDTIQVKGKIMPVSIYEVLNGEPAEVMELKLKLNEQYEKAWNLYLEGRIEEAVKKFKYILNINPADKASELHLKRCLEFM
jgi:class 3 adenylate cyclase/DNA-binding NarL/FixJ family response regulator